LILAGICDTISLTALIPPADAPIQTIKGVAAGYMEPFFLYVGFTFAIKKNFQTILLWQAKIGFGKVLIIRKGCPC
jgi:hypothetical protein